MTTSRSIRTGAVGGLVDAGSEHLVGAVDLDDLDFGAALGQGRVGAQPADASADDEHASGQHSRGEVDLVLFPIEVDPGMRIFPHRTLFTDRYVCTVWNQHSQVGDEITLDMLSSLPFLRYTPVQLASSLEAQLDAAGVERARTRGELLDATEAELARIGAATRRARRPLRGQDTIALAAGKVINKKKVAKHFVTEIRDDGLFRRRDEQKIAAEAALDGIYVIRTSLPADTLAAGGAVESCKALENVERVFRGLNTDLLIRPIRHRLAPRVRAHVLIRLLACYVTWHMQQRLAPILFQDDDPAAGRAARPSPVAPAGRSPAALAKITTKVTADGSPVHSLRSLLADLGTICANRIQPAVGLPAFTLITTPTPVQRRAFELLGVSCRLGYAQLGSTRTTPRFRRQPPRARLDPGELRLNDALVVAPCWRAKSCPSTSRTPHSGATQATTPAIRSAPNKADIACIAAIELSPSVTEHQEPDAPSAAGRPVQRRLPLLRLVLPLRQSAARSGQFLPQMN